MANKINYQIGFDVKKNTLNQLKASLQQLRKIMPSDIMKINNSDIIDANKKFLEIEKQAQNVEKAIQKAFNAKLNTVNIDEFNQSLKEADSSIQDVYRAFQSAGNTGESAFRNLSSHVLSANIQLKESHTLLDKMATTLANSAKWSISSGIVNNLSRSIQQAWGYTKALDSSLNDIRIVTGKSADEMANFAVQANNVAKELGKTTTDYTNAALIYAQQGLNDKEIAERAAITLKAANVTGQSTDAVSEQLTAVWNGYKVTADQAELYVDRLAAVAATTASDLEELSTGMSKVASAAAAMGVGQDQLAAQLSTIISVTKQAPESVGTALRTVYARISDIKAGIDEDGVTLGRYSGQMEALGFHVLDAAGNLRDMGEVMEEIGGRWQDLTREQQISLAQTMAGQRQYSNLIALFDNFEEYNKALNTAQNAAGTLQKQQDIYMESTAAHLNTLKASIENIYDSLTDTDSINGLIDGLAAAADLVANFVDSIGGGGAVLKSLGAIGVTVFSEQIAKSINTTITNLEIAKNNARQFDQALQASKDWQDVWGLDEASRKLLANREQLLELSSLMTPDQFSSSQKLLNDINSLGNEIKKIQDSTKDLEPVLKNLTNTSLTDVLGNEKEIDNIEAEINGPIDALEELQQKAKEAKSDFQDIFSHAKVLFPKDDMESFAQVFKKAQGYVVSLLDRLGELKNEKVVPEGFSQEIDNLEIEWAELTEKLSSEGNSEAVAQEFKTFFDKINKIATESSDDIKKKYEDLLKTLGNPELILSLEQKKQQLEKMVNDFISGQERIKKAAEINSYIQMAGGIAQVTSSMQQLMNVGKTFEQWRKGEISGGKALLQIISNVAISLPILATGLTKATTALGLMQVQTKEQIISAGYATAAELAHAASIKMVGVEAGKTAIRLQILDKVLLINPYVAAAAAVLALVTALGVFIKASDEANKAQQEFYEAEIEKENKLQEEVEANKQLYASLDELNQKYEAGEITRMELKSTIDDLIKQYGLEGEAADKLAGSYKNLTDYIRQSRLEAAKEAENSARREVDNAEQNIYTAAKGEAFDSGSEMFGGYSLELDAGRTWRDEPRALKNALINAGGLRHKDEISFTTNFDLPSLLTLYDNLNQVIKDMETEMTAQERQASQLYANTLEWLNQMQPKIEAYRDAIADVTKYERDRVALEAESNNKINFQGIESLADYISQRAELITQYKQLLADQGDTESDPAAMADAYISEYYNNLYQKYDESSKYIQKLREQFDSIDEESEDLFTKLPKNLQVLIEDMKLDDITDWEDFKNIVKYLTTADFSNFKIITDPDTAIESATSQYDLYSSLADQIKDSKKQTIAPKEFEKLAPEIQEFFSLMANGQYKMTGDAKEFYETVNNLSLQGFKQNIKDLQGSNQRLNNLKNTDYKTLNHAFNDTDFAQTQLDYLIQSGFDIEKIIQWKAELSDGNVQISTLNDIAAAVNEVGDNFDQFSTYLNANKDAIYQNELAIARSADSLKTLRGYLEQGQIGTKAFTQAAIELDRELDTQDLNQEELDNYADHLQEIAVQSDQLSNELEKNEDAAEIVAKGIMKMNDAVKTLSDNWEDWGSILNNSSGMSEEYSEAMDHTREAVADLLDTSKDFVSEDFIRNHLSEISQAAKGSETAIDSLKASLAQDLVARIMLENGIDETAQTDILSSIADLQAMIPDIEVGATIDDGDFLAKANQLIQDCGMTVDQANAMFDALGFEANFATEPQQVTQRVPKTITETQVTGYTSGKATDPTGQLIDWTYPILQQFSYNNGYEPHTGIVDVPAMATNGKTPIIKSLTRKAGGSFNSSSSKNPGGKSSGKKKGGGGGKKGGGSKKAAQPDTSKKDLKKEKEDQRDIYHDINIELDQINRELERVQEQQDRLYGKDLLDNLNKQTAILQQHKQVLEEKHELQEQDLKSQRETLENLGVTFDEYGNISNYLGILAQKQAEINARTKDYNSLIEAYNESTNKDMKKNIADEAEAINKQIKAAEDDYKQLEKKIKDYDGLREDMEDLVDQIEKETQKQVELNIKKFRTEIEIRLDMGEAERDWDQFRRDVLEHTDVIKGTDFQEIFSDALQGARDVTSYFDVNGSMGSLQMLTNQLMDTRAEIEAINETGKSAIYGDNKAQAMEDLQNDLNKLMDQMADVQKLIDDIDKAYLNTIDDIEDQFDKQIEDYEYIGELIQHDIDLLNLLYGEKNYDAMDRYFATLERNNLKQIDSLKQQRNFWREQWDAAVARGDTQAAKQFEQNYKETIKNLNSVIQDAAKNLQDRYINAIDKIFDTLDKKISNGHGTDYLSTEWELMNQNADEYLDTINAAFAIQQTQRKYRDALNDTQSIKNQQALRNLMNEQLDILKNKEKITQYDVDRAEKLLQVEQARIALEDAQSAKTSLRLKRDSQGNYSYEYAADNGAIDDARANLANAQNDLYNFDKERYQSNLDDMLSAWKDFQSEYKDIITDSALTEQQRIEKLALLREQYGQYINDKTAENLVVRNNLMESAFADIAALYNTDVDNYRQMSADEQNILMGDLVPAWESGIQQMADKVAGEGGFIPTCEEAFESIEEQTKSYQDSLQELADAAGMNLEDIQDGVDDLAYEFENLIEKNDDLIIRMNDQMLAIESLRNLAQALVNDYNNVYQAAAEAVTQLHQFVQAEKAAAAAYQETARAYESMINRIQRANAAYAANPYGNYPVGSGSSSGDSSSGNSGGGSGTGGGSKGGSSNPGGGSKYKNVTTSIYDGSGRTVSWKNKISYSTGGYTGNWNSDEGRPAILHQKEIVLNQDDTKNFLNGIKILRQMTANLGGTLANRMSGIGIDFGNSNNKDEINQNVHIEATFPNVDSKREIEEALNDLVNVAAQRALKI